jgi:hypothetical protein
MNTAHAAARNAKSSGFLLDLGGRMGDKNVLFQA